LHIFIKFVIIRLFVCLLIFVPIYLFILLFIDLFSYLQTAHDCRLRPEEVISNAKLNKIGTHIHTYTHSRLQTENTVECEVMLKVWVL